jgi:hypothetical protein
MARTGLTNLITWGVATLCVSYFLVPRPWLLLVAGAALGVAWLSRFWAEAIGVAAGVAAIFLLEALWSPVFLLAAAAIGGAAMVTWRQRAADVAVSAERAARAAVSTSRRLVFTTLVATFGVFVLNFVFSLGAGFSCDADARPGAPGSDRAAWCDFLSIHHGWAVILSVPCAVVFLGGIYAASRGRAREVLGYVVAGFVLVIAVHVPDVVF